MFLSGILFALLSGALASPTLQRRAAQPAPYSCTPGQACWPTKAEWQAFNTSVNGRLALTEPWARPCYTDPSSTACGAVELGYSDYDARISTYGSTDSLNWETCGSSNQCLLYTLNPLAQPTQNCSLGRLSAYYVDVRNGSDIASTLNFTKQHNLRLSIKNTGHDYLGRSTTANSLALWTHNLKNTEYHATFDQYQCKTGLENIGVVGAGVTSGEAYNYFSNYSMHVVVGAIESVGLAGGFGQGGGHGPLGPSYGLGVDQAVEFDVYTADGQFKTINECNDPDLFWAMRGGGGSTYAVLLNYKLQLHPAVPMNTYGFSATILPSAQVSDLRNSTVLHKIVTALANNQTSWSNSRVAGYNFISATSIESVQVLPDTDTDKLRQLTAQWHDFLTTLPGLNVTYDQYNTFATFPEYAAGGTVPGENSNAPVGVGQNLAGRLIPRYLFPASGEKCSVNATVPSRNASRAWNLTAGVDDSFPDPRGHVLADIFLAGLQASLSNGAGLASGTGQIYATGPANRADNSATGVNPAWRGSLWEVVYGGIWLSSDNATARANVAQTVGKAIQYFKDLTPGGGCYMNEADYLEEQWQQTFFGSNYERLLGVKQRYDPTGLFNCWKCVGWTGESDPFYSCYDQQGGNPTVPQDSSQEPVAPVAR